MDPCGINVLVDAERKTVNQKRGDNFKPLFLFARQPSRKIAYFDFNIFVAGLKKYKKGKK